MHQSSVPLEVNSKSWQSMSSTRKSEPIIPSDTPGAEDTACPPLIQCHHRLAGRIVNGTAFLAQRPRHQDIEAGRVTYPESHLEPPPALKGPHNIAQGNALGNRPVNPAAP